MEPRHRESRAAPVLTAQDLLAGSSLVHDILVPEEVRNPTLGGVADRAGGIVRIRPLAVGTLALISRAARDDPGLVPLLMIKESLIEPALSIDQTRQMHVGLVHFLVGKINQVSGLGPDGEALGEAPHAPSARAHLLLAKHFGWTPQQVSQLTPAQVMIYLASIEKLTFDQAGGAAE